MERHNYAVSDTDLNLDGQAEVSSAGQVYLYYCCPVEPGQPPLWLNPRWEHLSNDRQPLPSLEELKHQEESRR